MPDESAGSRRPVLILGGGIHGAAVARELVLNGVPVILVDTADLATGATSKSSRLIHGGLRYLEYGDVRLVRESLVERSRLLKLAPHFVRPLRLVVPTCSRWSGLLRSALGFFKLSRTRFGRRLMGRSERRAPRGYWPVRIGLWLYDLFSWSDGLPKSRGTRIRTRGAPRVDTSRYRWFCEYSDAQMRYPERCVIALLSDARQIAAQNGTFFQVVPYAELVWHGSSVRVSALGIAAFDVRPELVINTSGAWGDLTLKGIDAATTPLFAGTKGSHLVTRHPDLRAALGEQGVYAETGDRRLAFILPFGDSVLVGTTDEEWSGPPEMAVATETELAYLLKVVDDVFGLKLARSDIESHYSGVRPLPRSAETTTGAISRDHSFVEHRLHGVRILTLVGGKLTTFRSVAEQIADRVLQILHTLRQASTADRILPGGEGFPCDLSACQQLWRVWAAEFGTTEDEAAALWPLYGMRSKTVLAEVASEQLSVVAATPFQRRTVRWIIRNEWVTTLSDLVERRLMLVFEERLTLATLRDLAECFVVENRLSPESLPSVVEATSRRLEVHYGRAISD